MPPFPIYVIPYPLPIVPSPGSCPCYLVNPGNNSTSQGQTPQSQGYAPYGIIGFVPVVFVPYCPGNTGGMNTAQENFPNAVSVPYSCAQCKNRNSYATAGRFNLGRSIDVGELKEINSPSELETFLKTAVKTSRRGMRRLSAASNLRSEVKQKNAKKTSS